MTVRIGQWLVRRLSLTILLTAVLSGVVAVPAAQAATVPQPATVVGSCHVSGCSAALTAYHGWAQLGWPTSRGWYAWPAGRYNYAGGSYHNYDGQLPARDTFWEYDVYPRNRGAHRDAYRIVLDSNTGATWYSPDHYSTFYRIV